MNRYLMDTHILIWWLYDLPQLDRKYREIIENSENAIFVSVASFWEIEIKRSLGKLVIDEDYQKVTMQGGITILPVLAEHTLALRQLPDYHNDPFDRMLVSQAICEKMDLISADHCMKHHPVTLV